MTNAERIVIVLYAWRHTNTPRVDFEELGFVGQLSPKGVRLAQRTIRNDPEARALYNRILRQESA